MKYDFFSNAVVNTYKLNVANGDDEKCVLKFSMCDDKYPLYKLNKDELKTFIKYAKKLRI